MACGRILSPFSGRAREGVKAEEERRGRARKKNL
jgi:hypothetical protein